MKSKICYVDICFFIQNIMEGFSNETKNQESSISNQDTLKSL